MIYDAVTRAGFFLHSKRARCPRAAWIAFWERANNTLQENQTLFNDGASSPDENTSARHGAVAIYGAKGPRCGIA
jgi:hypothetical protein